MSKGLRKELTAYGDEGFSLFLRKAFADCVLVDGRTRRFEHFLYDSDRMDSAPLTRPAGV